MTTTTSQTKRNRVLVFGAGNFGSCLADHLADIDEEVYIWARDEKTVEGFNNHHRNIKYLTDHVFSKNLKAVGPNLPDTEFLKSCDFFIFAIPTQGLGKVLQDLKQKISGDDFPTSVYVNKGIEIGTNALPLEIIADNLSAKAARRAVFLSGPSFAKEIVKRLPTQVSVSSFSVIDADAIADLFHQPHFRCYVNSDPIGVEVAGALKNIYAIASGVASGLGLEANTRAGLVTRSLAEMTRVGVALGADPLTFLSLAGVGDLFLTCSSEKSRNFTVGRRLGEGETLDDIITSLGSVAEGVQTSKGVKPLIDKLEVRAPISQAVYKLLHEGGTANEMFDYLLNLERSRELHLPSEEHIRSTGVGEALRRKLQLDDMEITA